MHLLFVYHLLFFCFIYIYICVCVCVCNIYMYCCSIVMAIIYVRYHGWDASGDHPTDLTSSFIVSIRYIFGIF